MRKATAPVLKALLLALATGWTSLPLFAQTAGPDGAGEPVPEITSETPPDPGSGAPPQESVAPVPPAGPEAELAAREAALEEIEASISLSQERVDALRAEIAQMQGDRAQQNAALIAAAQRVRLAEIEIGAMEQRLGELIAAELEVRGRLDGADRNVASVLAALERISRNPPPALIVDPSDALGSARSAILISAILPQLKAQAEAVTADLERLSDIKAAAQEEEATLRANFTILEEEQLRIGTLIAARRQGEEQKTAELAAEEEAANALVAQAADLRQAIDGLAQRASALATAASATAAAEAGASAPRLDAETIRTALANPDRQAPAVPFAALRGYMPLPASGVTVIEYGAGDGFGGISSGVSVVTRADAQVVAPADGHVLYVGDYLNYGQIVILNAGQDYTILLAGLAETTVSVGQFVMMGEPVGVMGSRTIGRTVATSAGVSRPTLYIELRRNSAPVDPSGWWARAQTEIESG
ncbi:MAG: murein hydrolase activator EnvC family protein [Devosia sp.]